MVNEINKELFNLFSYVISNELNINSLEKIFWLNKISYFYALKLFILLILTSLNFNIKTYALHYFLTYNIFILYNLINLLFFNNLNFKNFKIFILNPKNLAYFMGNIKFIYLLFFLI